MSMVDDVVDLRENLHIVLACTAKARRASWTSASNWFMLPSFRGLLR